MQGMSAIEKGNYLLSNYEDIVGLAGQAAQDGEYVGTIGTGLTPGGWLAVIGASTATSSQLLQIGSAHAFELEEEGQ
jgi:GH24 family phage-related lysozyme (muramidase)